LFVDGFYSKTKENKKKYPALLHLVWSARCTGGGGCRSAFYYPSLLFDVIERKKLDLIQIKIAINTSITYRGSTSYVANYKESGSGV
jgi:hypothetical protein